MSGLEESLDQRLEEYRIATATTRTMPERALRWAALSSAASAAAALPLAAEASVIYSGVRNLTPTTTSTSSSGYGTARGTLRLDLDGDDVFDASILALDSGYYATVRWAGGSNALIATTTGSAPANNARAFGSGESIGASAQFQANRKIRGSGGSYSFSWGDSQSDGIIGFELNGNYGWLRIDLQPAEVDFTVVDWAYESVAGRAISAGDIPEPGAAALTGLGLLALGVRGIRSARKTRQSARHAARGPSSAE